MEPLVESISVPAMKMKATLKISLREAIPGISTTRKNKMRKNKMKRESGMKRAPPLRWSAAVRALAYKWIRIIFRMWQTHTMYSEKNYLEQLTKNNSPILNFLET